MELHRHPILELTSGLHARPTSGLDWGALGLVSVLTLPLQIKIEVSGVQNLFPSGSILDITISVLASSRTFILEFVRLMLLLRSSLLIEGRASCTVSNSMLPPLVQPLWLSAPVLLSVTSYSVALVASHAITSDSLPF